MSTAILRDLVARANRSRVLDVAAGIAFWVFLALVPLATVGGLLTAKIAREAPDLGRFLAPLPPVARELVTSELSRLAAFEGDKLTPTAILVFLWLASSGVHAIFDAMEVETACPRPWWKKRLVAILVCVFLSIGSALLAIIVPGLRYLTQGVPGLAVEIGGALFAGLVALGMAAGLFVAGVPKAARREMPILPGAALVVILEAVLGNAYGFYISKAGIGSAYLAGLAVIGVTMTALYLSALALLVGLELSLVLRDRRREKKEAPGREPEPSGAGRAAEAQ